MAKKQDANWLSILLWLTGGLILPLLALILSHIFKAMSTAYFDAFLQESASIAGISEDGVSLIGKILSSAEISFIGVLMAFSATGEMFRNKKVHIGLVGIVIILCASAVALAIAYGAYSAIPYNGVFEVFSINMTYSNLNTVLLVVVLVLGSISFFLKDKEPN